MNLPSWIASMKLGVQLNSTMGAWRWEADASSAHSAEAEPALTTTKSMPRASTRSWSFLSQSTGPARKRPLGLVSGVANISAHLFSACQSGRPGQSSST